MTALPLVTPPFGQADLSNCEREQIQFAGSIQPHGILLVLREPDHVILQASTNVASMLGMGEVCGRRLNELGEDLANCVRALLRGPLHKIPAAKRCRVGNPPQDFDCVMHRPPDGGLVVELIPSGPPVDFPKYVEPALARIVASSSLRTLCDETASIFRDLTGYDRVMVYRFDDEGHGEVFSENRRTDLEPYLGNRYPSTDIPHIARRLYERNRVRIIVDVEYAPVPLAPRLSPATGRDLDMSLCCLRSMSPIHVQYLKNMGVSATLVASLIVGGKLWGLVSCHHYAPRFVHFDIQAACELLAEAVATRIAALESFVQAQAELFVRRLEQRLVEAVARDGDWRAALFDSTQSLLQPLAATGAALLFENQVLTVGEVPGTHEIRELGAWLDAKPRAPAIATASLGLEEGAAFQALTPVASGLLAAPVSQSFGEYLIWFRPERVRTVTWAGNPLKAVEIGNDPLQLSPRRSFAQWHQLVEGTSEPWTPTELTAARLIGETISDVVLQFRTVRLLIAQDQLEQVSRQVLLSAQPVIITDPRGRILISNEAFQRLLRAGHPHLQWLDDLPSLFEEPLEARRRLQELVDSERAWRGEVTLQSAAGSGPALMVRADPVFSAPGRVLGFVLLFTDLTERKAAEAARRRFQEGIVYRHPVARPDSQLDVAFQAVLSSLIENAQLAALEITYGVDTARMPEMLESVRTSVARASEVLEHLMVHTQRVGRHDPGPEE